MWETVKSSSTILLVFGIVLFFVSQTTNADIYQSIEDPRAKAFGNRVCTTKECAIIAGRYFNNGNEKVDPCDDFATYSCGNYMYQPDTVYEESSVFGEINFKIKKKLTAILEAPPSADDKPWHILAKTFYRKCLEEPAANKKSDSLPILDELGGWPLLNTHWNEFGLSYEQYLADIHKKTGYFFLFKTTVKPNSGNTSEYELWLEPNLSLLGPSVQKMAIKLGAQNPHLVQEVEKFSKKFTSIHQESIEEIKDGQRSTLYNMKKMFPDFDLEKYVLHLFDGIAPVNSKTPVVVVNVPFFKKLHTLFTNKRDFANYAISALVNNYFKTVLQPEMTIGTLRAQMCYQLLTDTVLVKPVTQMYVKKYIDHEVIVPKLTKMVKAIIEVLADMLNNAEWLDNDTRKNALNKLNHMEYSFVHPENLFDDTLLIEKDIPPSEPSESFINLLMRVWQNKFNASLAKVTEQVEKTEWVEPPLVVNGMYLRQQNKFAIGINILESPHFNPNVPDYVTYATVGVIAGHEIMHGFDDIGRLYDEAGNLRNWWKKETADKYVEKANCFVNQYTEEGVDGQLSLGENIGDNVGMELAYKAYKKVMGNATEPALPGFEHFTVDQMFFLSYANAWCTSLKKGK